MARLEGHDDGQRLDAWTPGVTHDAHAERTQEGQEFGTQEDEEETPVASIIKLTTSSGAVL